MSGGQQRRMSFAAALIHEPELLILDEPTVGVDPVLRQVIQVSSSLENIFARFIADDMGLLSGNNKVRENNSHHNNALHRRDTASSHDWPHAWWKVFGGTVTR